MGFLPFAPGTWGSLVGLALFLILAIFPLPVYGIVLGISIPIGLWTANRAEQLLGEKDASPIVIDEIVGILLTYFLLPTTLFSVLSGFFFFRLFDILKPVPQIEQLPGGWGIMLDDLCAGVLAQCSVRLVLWLV